MRSVKFHSFKDWEKKVARRQRTRRSRIRRLLFEQFEDRRLLDGSGPRVLSITPTEVRNATYDHVDVTFSTTIDATSFTPSDVKLDGPSGSVVVSNVSPLTTSSFRIQFAPLTIRGDYQIVIGPDVLDLAGNLMNQDNDATNGEATEDQYRANLRLILADTIFTTATTISESNTTFDMKSILIDGATVAIDGAHKFTSVQIVNGGVLTHSANSITLTHTLDVNVVELLMVDSTSRIDVTGKGYLPGRTTGNSTVGASTAGSGGSYGGSGRVDGGSSNLVYGDYANPDEPGAGSAPTAGAAGVKNLLLRGFTFAQD